MYCTCSIQLNLVHDPQEEDDNDNIECQELGTANLKLLEVSTYTYTGASIHV